MCGAQCDGTILSSSDGITWVEHHPSPAVWGLYAVAYGNGHFVAVGNAILTSDDGVNWTQRQFQSQSYSLTGIVYGNDQFVAVGDYSLMATSPDGVNWALRDSGTSNDLPAIAFGNGQFVVPTWAPGAPPSILTSTGAVTWVSRWSGMDYSFLQFIGVGFGNGLWVAVGAGRKTGGQDEPLILTSSDGVQWTQRPSGAATDFLSAVAYGNAQFVAIGDEGTILTSSDGVTWVSRRGPTTDETDDFTGVAYGNG
jgi:photosystem II stability/assembly factor-like uncharacterized protein